MLSDRRQVSQQRLRKRIKYLTPQAGAELASAGVPSVALLIDCRGVLLLDFVGIPIVTESPNAGFVVQAFSQSGQFFSEKALRAALPRFVVFTCLWVASRRTFSA